MSYKYYSTKLFVMKIIETAFLIAIGGLCSFTQQTKAERKMTSYVDPFIGTGGAVNGSSLSGNNFPGATVPFGMVQLSPDTRNEPDWSSACGYDHNDNTIAGFSHTHLSGTGVPELFDILVMPMTGEAKTIAGDVTKSGSGYMSRFSHENEEAKPGYYKVLLSDFNILAELTATAHSGFHRYTYPHNSTGHLIFDLNHSLKKPDWGCHVIDAQLKIVNNHTLEGFRIITGWAKLRKVYFHAEFSKQILKSSLVDGNAVSEGQKVLNGTNLRAALDFDTEDKFPLLMKIGLSSVSVENAESNLKTEIPGWNFDEMVALADEIWEKELGKIKVSGTEEQKRIFYTSLYHTFIQPNNIADINGDYQASDYSIRRAENKTHYSTFSLWDTFRGAHPLYTLIQSDRNRDFVLSLMRQYDTYGYLPIWQLWGEENYCMIGNHSIPVIVDAVLKGTAGIDARKAYEAVKNSSITSHLNSPFTIWDKYHYMPENLQSQSVSITLEMAYDDWCVARLAQKLGETDDYEYFMKRSQYYRNLFDPGTSFFRAKDDKGHWLEPFDPFQYGANGGNPFTEGNAWQYFWFVPHDVEGLIGLTGGKIKFTRKIDDFFTLNNHHQEANGNASGFIGQYAHGNEPSHHVAYLYDYADQPWKTQFYTAKIMQELYSTSSAGYSGNEDCGQMSAWYVLSAMGFYPVNPVSGNYAIGSPVLEKAEIKLQDGKTFMVIARNVSRKNIYIQSAKLNGKIFNRTILTHNEITEGGTLEFVMGDKPNKKWGVK
ncbi:MAG: GH92 family glycosyl hydrolase [Bacteroidota bacterium]|nr:GH92 family glycosyl hydrolase [Bacteroidota bacterium]